MSLNQNQFSMTAVTGQKDALVAGVVLPVKLVDAASAGDALKLDATSVAGGVIHAAKAAAKGDSMRGVLLHNVQKSDFVAGEIVEMGMQGTVVLLPMGAATSAEDELVYDPATKKYVAAASGEAVVAVALTSGATDELVRCLIVKAVKA